MDTVAHDTSSSDLDEGGLEHVFVLREGEYLQNYAWKWLFISHLLYFQNLCENLGPYSWEILVLRVAPSNKILRKFLNFTFEIEEKILVKNNLFQKAS